MSKLLSLILSRLELDCPRLDHDELADFPPSQLAALRRCGVLRAAAPAASIECRECGLDERRHVAFMTRRGGAEPESFIHCSLCGVVRIDRERLLRWTVDAEALARQLAAALGASEHPTCLVPGHLWRVARRRLGGGARDVLLLPRMARQLRDAVAQPLSRRPRAVVLVPTETTVLRLRGMNNLAVFALEGLLHLESGALSFDAEVLEQDLAGDLPPAKRPVRKRASRAGKIELLERELIEHLRAARDHAAATAERGDGPRHLPRPSQRELGRRCGLSESDVSRCLRDPAARQLAIYWRTADDPTEILRWATPRGGRPGR